MMEFKIKERIAGKVVRENRDPVHGVAKMVCAADKVGWEVAVMETRSRSLPSDTPT